MKLAASLFSVVVAAWTSLAPVALDDPPRTEAPVTAPDSLDTWRERAARAQDWLRARGEDAEKLAADGLARARRELLGVESPVAAATLAMAIKPAEEAGGKPLSWSPITTETDSFDARTCAVVLVHGLDEPGTIWDELAPRLVEHDVLVVRFDYPNDQGICDCAGNFKAALRQLRSLGVERVSIVAHSMGGLVAREVLTCRDGYAANGASTEELPAVNRLIMVGTPNHGAPLAGLQAIAEAREQVVRRVQGTSSDGSGLVGWWGDGRGEAGRDLGANSEFLKALNSRPHAEGVKMTTICGRVTPAQACQYLRIDASTQWARFIGTNSAEALTEQACAAVETLGDGMVPVESTRLDGVDDHVEIAADHRSMLKRWAFMKKLDQLRGEASPPAPAIPVILERLGLEPLEQRSTLPAE